MIFFITDGYNTGPATDDEVIEENMRIKEIFGAEMYVIGNVGLYVGFHHHHINEDFDIKHLFIHLIANF